MRFRRNRPHQTVCGEPRSHGVSRYRGVLHLGPGLQEGGAGPLGMPRRNRHTAPDRRSRAARHREPSQGSAAYPSAAVAASAGPAATRVPVVSKLFALLHCRRTTTLAAGYCCGAVLYKVPNGCCGIGGCQVPFPVRAEASTAAGARHRDRPIDLTGPTWVLGSGSPDDATSPNHLTANRFKVGGDVAAWREAKATSDQVVCHACFE